MDIKGKKLTVKEIEKLENGTKVWVEDSEVDSGCTGVYIKGEEYLESFSTRRYMTFTFDFEEIEVYEWHEDMVEVKKDYKTRDKVKMLKKVTGLCDMGEIGIVTENDTDRRYGNNLSIQFARGEGINFNYNEVEFVEEKIMEKQFTKSDLKSGMVVEFRESNEQYLIVGNILSSNKSWSCLDNFSDDLTNKISKTLDIVKIYKLVSYQIRDFVRDGKTNVKPIWERKETPVIDWSKVEKDTLIEVNFSGDKIVRYFAKYNSDNGKVYFYAHGTTSLTWKDLGNCEAENAELYKVK